MRVLPAIHRQHDMALQRRAQLQRSHKLQHPMLRYSSLLARVASSIKLLSIQMALQNYNFANEYLLCCRLPQHQIQLMQCALTSPAPVT